MMYINQVKGEKHSSERLLLALYYQ